MTGAAELLFNILNITERKTDSVNILIACNKSESFTARPPQKIKEALENEISSIISRKKQSLSEVKKNVDADDDDNDDDEFPLLTGMQGDGDFKFSMLEGSVDCICGSVIKQNTQKWSDWIHDQL